MQRTAECILELGDTVKDQSDSIRFLVLCQPWNLGGGYWPLCPPPGYAYASGQSAKVIRVKRVDIGLPILFQGDCYKPLDTALVYIPVLILTLEYKG